MQGLPLGPYDKQGGIVFDQSRAAIVQAASAQLQRSFDGQMARAVLEASDMRAAYDKLTCENADQKKAAQVHNCGPMVGGHACM